MTQTTAYPRVYQYGPIAKIVWSVVAMVMTAAGLVTGLSWLIQPDTTLSVVLTAMGIPFAGFGVVCLISTLRGKLVLYEDRVAYVGVIATRYIRFQDIARTEQWTRLAGQFSVTLVLKSGKRVTICDFGKMDDVLDAWLVSYPNAEVDAEITAQETLSAAVGQNPAFGSTEDERHARYNRHTRVVSRLFWVSLGLSGACIFLPAALDLPRHSGVYLLMALPSLCVLAAIFSQGRWSVTEDNRSGRLSLSGLALSPILALTMVAAGFTNMVEWLMPIASAVVAAMLMTGVVIIVERSFRWAVAGNTLLLCFVYAGSTGLLLNAFLDDARPRIEHTRVTGKRTSTDTPPDYYLQLEWRQRDRSDYEVPRDLYDATKPGGTACMAVYPGTFGWEYAYVEPCPAAAKP